MPAAPLPVNEELRLAALHEYDILDTPPEASFDRITRLACQLLDVPMSVVSLVDKDRQWFKSCAGVRMTETPRAPSFCAHTILTDQILNVPDAMEDPRFSDSSLVTGPPFIRFYLGIPLRSSSGYNIGSFCVMSTEPRVIPEADVKLARELAAIVTTDLGQRLALKQLRLNHARLLQMEKMSSIGQLVSGVAHEFNTPMQFLGDNANFLKEGFETLKTLIRGYEMLVKSAREKGIFIEECNTIHHKETEADLRYLSREIPMALNQSLDGISRVQGLVTAMKAFSQGSQNEKKCSDLNKGIEATVTISRNEWKYASELVTELDPELPMVPCDLGEINQVILNLVINAAHSIQDAIELKVITRGLIRIKTSQEDGQAVVVVEDNGMGIPASIINKIFDPFFTTKKIGKGTGQGLAITYDIIVHKHKGTIEVTSTPRQGASFRITLPLEKPNP